MLHGQRTHLDRKAVIVFPRFEEATYGWPRAGQEVLPAGARGANALVAFPRGLGEVEEVRLGKVTGEGGEDWVSSEDSGYVHR